MTDRPPQSFEGDYRVVGERTREPFIHFAALRALLARIAIALCWGGVAYGVSKAVHWAWGVLHH